MLLKVSRLKADLDLFTPFLNLFEVLCLLLFDEFALFQPYFCLGLQIFEGPLVEQLVVHNFESDVVLVLLHFARGLVQEAPNGLLISIRLVLGINDRFAMLFHINFQHFKFLIDFAFGFS